jgi:hypothetical protein
VPESGALGGKQLEPHAGLAAVLRPHLPTPRCADSTNLGLQQLDNFLSNVCIQWPHHSPFFQCCLMLACLHACSPCGGQQQAMVTAATPKLSTAAA